MGGGLYDSTEREEEEREVLLFMHHPQHQDPNKKEEYLHSFSPFSKERTKKTIQSNPPRVAFCAPSHQALFSLWVV